MTTTLDSLIARADLLGADCARIAADIERCSQDVEDARRLPADYAQQLKDLNAHIDEAEITIEAEVSTETVDAMTSTLKYKTETQRKSASQARIAKDPELINLNREKRIVERQKSDADMKLSGAADLLKALGHVQALKHSEAMLIAATICALAPDAPSPATIGKIEAVIVERLSVSLKSGKMREIIQATIADQMRKPAGASDTRA